MIDKNIIFNVLDKTGYKYGDIAKKKHGSSPEILVGDLFTLILEGNTGPEIASILGIGVQTFNRTIRRLFPEVRLHGGFQTWKSYLMLLSDYKKCTLCSSLRLKSEFYSSANVSYDTLSHACKECSKGRFKEYYENNKGYHNFQTLKRKNKVKNQCPSWADIASINEIYKNCPEGYHVDHIIPLQGKLVSGLHVPENLQYLTAEDNLRKGNKFEV